MRILKTQKKRLCIYSTLILLMFIVILPVFSLFYLFNENQTKAQILATFNNNYYDVKINGHITPELWHGLSIKIHSISIRTKNNNELLHISSMNCQFSWFNAIFGNYKLRRVSINDVDFYEKNVLTYGIRNLFSSKSFNISDFKELSYFEINDIHSIGNTSPYNFDDGNLKVYWENDIPEFKFGTTLLDKNLYLMVTGSFGNFMQNTITFNQFNTVLYNQAFNIQTKGMAKYQVAKNTLTLDNINGSAEFMGYKGAINANNINISKVGISAKNTSIKINVNHNLLQQNIELTFDNIFSNDYKNILFKHVNLLYKNTFEKDSLKLSSSFDHLMIESNGSIISTTCNNNLSIKTPDVIHDNINAKISGVCEYTANNKIFNFHLAGTLNNQPLQLNLQLLNKNKPNLIISGEINNLNLSRVNQDEIIPLYSDRSHLPFSWLSFMDMNAKLNIHNFTLDRFNLTDVKTDFRISHNKLNLIQLQAKLYNGNLLATGSITKNDDNSYDIWAKQKLDNLDIKLMFKNLFDVEAISGKANVLTNITAKNVSCYNDLHKKLNGIVDITATNGAFQGIDFNLFTSPKPLTLTNVKMTPFKSLNAHFNFTDGISKNGTINFSSPYLLTSGNGIIDFSNTTLNYNLTIQSQLPNNAQKIKAVVIPVTAIGDLFSPKISIEKIYLSNKKPTAGKPKVSHHKKHHKS